MRISEEDPTGPFYRGSHGGYDITGWNKEATKVYVPEGGCGFVAFFVEGGWKDRGSECGALIGHGPGKDSLSEL
jgi:hypothetical protein